MKREDWIEAVAVAVDHVADKGYQRETWFGGKERISSPEELYYQLLSDRIFEDFLTSEEINLSEVQKKAGQDLVKKMDEYFSGIKGYPDPFEVFDDPEWEEVRKAARKFLETLRN